MQPIIFSRFLNLQRTDYLLQQGPAELETTIIRDTYLYFYSTSTKERSSKDYHIYQI